MTALKRFINDSAVFLADPPIRTAPIHHRFRSVHPFRDGGGRSRRIINVLYHAKQGLPDIPALYPCRYSARQISLLQPGPSQQPVWRQTMTISKSSASGKTIAVLIRDDTQRRSIPIVELAPMMCDKDQVIKLLRDPEDFNLTIFAI